jgi:hypothetical protein
MNADEQTKLAAEIAAMLRERQAAAPPPTGIRAELAKLFTPEKFGELIAAMPSENRERLLASMREPPVRIIYRKPKRRRR